MSEQDEIKVTGLSTVIVPIHPKGYPFIAIAFAIAFGLFFVWPPLGWLMVIIGLWCVYFFRDPPRVTPVEAGDVQNLVIAPADGRVQMIELAKAPKELGLDGDKDYLRISIFLNVFDVHVNRAPVSGKLEALEYVAGKFLNASLDKASEENERCIYMIRRDDGKEIIFTQIAGLVARRIVYWVTPTQILKAGERFGLIRFGSRTDIYLPMGIEPKVVVGQSTLGGETVLADLSGEQVKIDGEIR